MIHIKKEVRNLKRLEEILIILFEEGFGYFLDRVKLTKHLPLKKRMKKAPTKTTPPQVRLRKTLERLGATFIKFGQVLSVRPDLLPPQYIKELEKLQDAVPPFPFSQVKKTVEKELGRKITDVYSEFDEKPIASASISQVHKARLKNKTTVAVKVRRPNVEKIMEEDIEIMLLIARLLNKHIKAFHKYEPVRIVKEFQEWTKNELNFLYEARNAKIFYRNFADDPNVVIPKVFQVFSTEKILTLEYVYGTELHDIKGLKKRKLDVEKILKKGFDAILKQVFLHGFFHADPHPGNIIITRTNRIAFVDFGIVGRFSDEDKELAIDMLYSIVFHDVNRLMTVLEELGIDEDCDIKLLKKDLLKVIEPVELGDVKDVKLSRMLEEVLGIAVQHNLKLPLEFTLLGKTIITLEGIGLKYNPQFRLIQNARPFVENLMLQRLSPVKIVQSLFRNSLKIKKFTETFPDQATKALKKIQNGTIKVDLSHTDLKQLSVEIDKSSNRLAYAMLVTGLIITGALTINIDLGPRIYGIPIISFSCFLFALLFGLFFILSVLNEKRMR